jgi:hypothetical protein
MSYIDKFLPRKSGVVGKGVHALVEAAAPAAMIGGFGYVMNRYRDKSSMHVPVVGNVPVDLGAGVLGLAMTTFGLTSLLGRVTGIGFIKRHASTIDKLAGAVATAGLGSYAHTYGAGLGGKHSGVTRVAVDKKDVARIKAAVPNATVLGEIPAAPHGDFLSSEDLRKLARS